MTGTGRHIALTLLGFGWLLVAIVPARAAPVRISQVDCATLVAHGQGPDVAYQAGVDVRGEAVVPADLGGRSPVVLPETTHILIKVDVIERLGLAIDPSSYDADTLIGWVGVTGDQVTFNGQPIATSAAQELADLCYAGLERID